MRSSSPRNSPDRWRLALLALALASLGPLWWISGSTWGGGSGEAEIRRAREALAGGRHEEAWSRAERVLGSQEARADTDAEAQSLAAEAAFLAAQARLAAAAADGATLPSAVSFAAWRAHQAATLGGDPAACARLRLDAARLLRRRGQVAEAAAELEKIASDGAATPASERERALALAAVGGEDLKRALAIAREQAGKARTALERAQAGIVLGAVLEAGGSAEDAERAYGEAAATAEGARLGAESAEARLGRARALLASGGAGGAIPLLRDLLRHAPSPEQRESAGVLLVEADAVADEGSLAGDFGEFRLLPASPEALFAARARIAIRRLGAGRLSDAAATWAAAFGHLGSRPFPGDRLSSREALADLARLVRHAPDPEDCAALAVAAEGLAVSLPESEGAFELAAEIAERRAGMAAESRDSARRAGTDGDGPALEARALYGRAAEFRLAAADNRAVVKSRSVANRMHAARDLVLGEWHEAALPVLLRLVDEIDSADDRSAEARWLAARTLQALGRHDEAADALSRFLERHRTAPTRAHDAFVELAKSQEALGEFEKAEATLNGFLFHYDNVTPDSPRWREALFQLGDLQARRVSDLKARGDETAAAAEAALAVRNLKDAVRRFPADLENRFRAEVRIGMLAMGRRDWDGAAQSLRSALALPGRAGRAADSASGAGVRRASLLLGECLWQRGETVEALEAFGQAWTSEVSREAALALSRMADCHERLGDARQAERFRERSRAALAEVRAIPGAGAGEELLERLVVGR